MKSFFLAALMFSSSLQATDQLFDFNSSADTALPSELQYLNKHAPLKLPIKAFNDRLVQGDGVPLKLWGGVLRLTSKLLELNYQEKSKLIESFAKIGFRELRLIGVDFQDPGIYRDWLESGEFPATKMRSLCEFTELIKSSDLLYTIDINHISGKYSRSSNGKIEAGARNKANKVSQLFNKDIVRDTNHWFEQFLKVKHPGCAEAYAIDQSFFYINVVNEDSLFNGYHSGFVGVSDKDMAELMEQYIKFKTEEIDFHGNQKFCKFSEYNANSRDCQQTVRFLKKKEEDYFGLIISTIRSTGYEGLITTTNNWYGPINRDVNYRLGDAMNTHTYFSPVRKKKILGKELKAVNNFSFVSDLQAYRGWDQNHLYRLPAILYPNRPVIVSEWNHSLWSDYLYEGAILLTGLAMQQDVSVMTVHTLLGKYSGEFAERADTAYTVFGNPVLYAMLPTLAAAFGSKSSLGSSQMQAIEQINEFSRLVSGSQEIAPLTARQRSQLPEIFSRKARLGGHGGSFLIADHSKSAPIINWSDESPDTLSVNSGRYAAVVGVAKEPVSIAVGISVSFDTPGAVLFLALDTQDLETAHRILVTTVSGFDQGDEIIKVGVGKHSYNVLAKQGKRAGRLEKHVASLHFATDFDQSVALRPIYQNAGTAVPLSNSGKDKVILVGNEATPWYLLEFSTNN